MFSKRFIARELCTKDAETFAFNQSENYSSSFKFIMLSQLIDSSLATDECEIFAMLNLSKALFRIFVREFRTINELMLQFSKNESEKKSLLTSYICRYCLMNDIKMIFSVFCIFLMSFFDICEMRSFYAFISHLISFCVKNFILEQHISARSVYLTLNLRSTEKVLWVNYTLIVCHLI